MIKAGEAHQRPGEGGYFAVLPGAEYVQSEDGGAGGEPSADTTSSSVSSPSSEATSKSGATARLRPARSAANRS